jgi:serine/threonine protein kinase
MSGHQYQAGQEVDGWTLVSRLGKGGNAEVWRARRPVTGNEVALKLLKERRRHAEPYKRFRAEIEILTKLGERPGILPIIAHSLPDSGTPWLAMPVASGITEALGQDPSLESVVKAVCQIAATLAGLTAVGVSHRDIKPGNLYSYRNQWVVGDFGLADFPDKEPLTTAGKKLGPQFYLADEMLNAPTTADGELADVYSLAKTLWVLATGQNYPPQGEQRVDVRSMNLSTYVSHPKAYLLDRLIEQATSHEPTARPKMKSVAEELIAWAEIVEGRREPAPDAKLGEIAGRLSVLIEPAKRENLRREQQIGAARKILDDYLASLKTLSGKLDQAGVSGCSVGDNHSVHSAFARPLFESDPKRAYVGGCCLVVEKPGQRPRYLWCGYGMDLFENGEVRLVAGSLMGPSTEFQQKIWNAERRFIIGTSLQEKCVSELEACLDANFAAALSAFAASLESSRDK